MQQSSTSPPQPGKQPPELSHYMRWLMRRIPQPVVVITTSSPSSTASDEPLNPCAMTVSSFTTVTLTPTPYVSFNIRKPSSTYTAITEAASTGDFLMHILSASPAGAHIADTLARGNAAEGLQALRKTSTISNFATPAEDSPPSPVASTSPSAAHPNNSTTRAKPSTVPLPLITGPGVLEVLHCRLTPSKQIDVGDHVVLIASVLRSLTTTMPNPETLGLSYMMRAYQYQDGETLGPAEKGRAVDIYTYQKGISEERSGTKQESSPAAIDRGGLRVSIAGSHIRGKRVNATYVPTKRWLPAVKARGGGGVGVDGGGQKEQEGRVQKKAAAAEERKDTTRDQAVESQEIHRTIAMNVRRGDEGFPAGSGGG